MKIYFIILLQFSPCGHVRNELFDEVLNGETAIVSVKTSDSVDNGFLILFRFELKLCLLINMFHQTIQE